MLDPHLEVLNDTDDDSESDDTTHLPEMSAHLSRMMTCLKTSSLLDTDILHN